MKNKTKQFNPDLINPDHIKKQKPKPNEKMKSMSSSSRCEKYTIQLLEKN